MFKKLFGDPNEKHLKELRLLTEKVNELEPKFEGFSDSDFKEKTEEFKGRLKNGESLDDILVEAFALVREAAKKTLDQRHYDVQVMTGISLHYGEIVEMKTGEGKTLASTMPIYLNALLGKGVHVVTVNDYLVRRETNWMGPVFDLLGLSVGCLSGIDSFKFNPHGEPDDDEVSIEYENLEKIERGEAYEADVTYGTNNQFGFDYLRDNMVPSKEQMVQRPFYYAIIDEIDSVLIDEARTPLIISAPDEESSVLYREFSKIVPRLDSEKDYEVDAKDRTVTLTEEGLDSIEKILGTDLYKRNAVKYIHHLEQALRAEVIFKRDRDYVVDKGQVVIVDQATGRMMPRRRFSSGLHQALEAKEKVVVQEESRTLATITFQNYFRLYGKLSGMTGTAATSAEEFAKVYGLDVTIIPTNRPIAREDLPDKIFKTENGKFKAVVREIKELQEKGQPVLIGTISVEKNEKLAKLLKKEGVRYEVLNAKNHEREAQIIAKAGEKGSVTVATNMAGRGVDIKLTDEVKELGGLFVLGTERHESRRIDNQLRGRGGRQGDAGASAFYVSLEDELMRAFSPERVKGMMDMLKIPEDEPIEHKLISKSIEQAQERLEGFNFDSRKHVLEYDDVLSRQREVIYGKRMEAFEIGDSLRRGVTLRVIDLLWMGHLDTMDHLKDSVNLRAYGQRDPLLEYKKESKALFGRLVGEIDHQVEHLLIEAKKAQDAAKYAGVKRNDPCPCGSDKKFKRCHLNK
jgi:preprotein translocase subunit SecA